MKLNRCNGFLFFFRRLFSAPVLLLGMLGISQASQINWSGVSSTAWATGTNWTGGNAPANSTTTDTAVFSLAAYPNLSNAGTTSVAGVQVGTGSATAALTLSGTQLTIGASGIDMKTGAGAGTISSPVTLGTDQTWQNASANKLTVSGAVTNGGKMLTTGGAGNTDISGVISGTGGLVKSDLGVVALSKTNTYTGNTIVNAGILDLTGGGGSNGTIRGTATVNAGSILRLSTGDATGYDPTTRLSIIELAGGSLNVNSTSNQTLGNATINMTGASITGISGSNLDFYQGSSTLNVLASGTTSIISGVTLSPLRQGNTTFTVADGAAAIDLDISSVIRPSPSGDNASATLIKAGPGSMRLTGVNTFARNFTINAGSVEIGGAGLLGAGAYANNITNAGTLRFNTTANQSLSGVLSGAGALVKDNTGSLVLAGANTYTGTTTINAGSLSIGSVGSAPFTDITVKNGGALLVGASGKTLKSIAVENGAKLALPADSIGTPIAVNTLAFTSSPTVSFAPQFPVNPVPGTYTLLAAGALSGTPAAITTDLSAYAGSRAVASSSTALVGNNVVLTVGAGSANLVWSNHGGTGTGNWSLNTPADSNFWNGSSDGAFFNLDNVTFDDTAFGTVNLVGALNPAQITVNASAGDYTFSGSGALTGSGPLSKLGSSTLTLATANSTYTGPISIGGGVLAAGNATAFGAPASASLAFPTGSSGTVRLNGNNITIANLSNSVGFPVIESGSDTAGTDVLTLGSSVANTFTGIIRDGFVRQLGLTSSGAGNLTLGGTLSNQFTGPLTISTLGATNIRSVFLAKSGGAVAVGENGSVIFGTGTTGESNLRMLAPNQFGAGVAMTFLNASGNWARFDLMGTAQTLAGLNAGNVTTAMGAIVQNRPINDTGSYGPVTLTLNGSGSYLYNGTLRDADSGINAQNTLSLVKTGTGTQTLAGTGITYSGTTTVNGGTLALDRGTAKNNDYFNSSGGITISTGGTLQINQSANTARLSNVNRAITGGGTLLKTGAGTTTLANDGGLTSSPINLTAGGLVDVQGGALGGIRTLSTNRGSLNIAAGAVANFDNFLNPNQSNDAYLDMLTGTGMLSFDAGITRRVHVGVAGGTSTFTGTFSPAGLILSMDAGGSFTLDGSADTSNLLAEVTNGYMVLGKTSSGAGTSGAGARAVGGIRNIGPMGYVQLAGSGGEQIYGFGTGDQGRVVMNGGVLDLSGTSEGWDRLDGNGYVFNMMSATTSVMRLGENNGSSSFSGSISDGGGVMALTKVGTGRFTLGGSNAYTGATTVSAGTLQLDGSIPFSNLSVADGASVAGKGTAASITLGASTGAGLVVDPSTPGSLLASGSLTVNGTVTVSLANNGFTPGTPITIATFGSKGGSWSAANFAVANSGNYRGVSFSETANSVTMTVLNRDLAWNNAGGDLQWSTSGTANFLDTGTSLNSAFLWPDNVTFGDLPGANQTVSVIGQVQPGGLVFNSQYNYVLNNGGSAGITGSLSLLKDGTGAATLNFANTFTGSTTLQQGTLNAAAAGALGTSAVTVNGGILNATAASLNGNAAITLNGGVLNANAAGALGASPVALNGGVLSLGNATAHGTAMLTFGGGSIRYGSGVTADVSGIIRNSTSAMVIDTNGQSSTFSSVIDSSNTGGLTKTGAGTLTLGAAGNLYSGGTTVTGGVLKISNDLQLGPVPAAATAGSLVLNGGTLGISANMALHANRGITVGSGGGIDSSLAGNASGVNPTVAGMISGSGGLIVKANGETTDGGTSSSYTAFPNPANDFTGDLTITAGIVRIDGGFGNASNRIILNGGGLVDTATNTTLSRDFLIGASGGFLRTYSTATTTHAGSVSNLPGVASAQLRHVDTGKIKFSGSGSGFTGTYYNARGTTEITAAGANWATTDFVLDTAGSTLAFNGGGTASARSISSTRDVLVDNGTTLNLGTGGLSMATNGHWMKTSAGSLGSLTSSTGTVTITNGSTSGTMGTLDHQIQVLVKNYDVSTPVTLVKNNTNQLVVGQANTYSGGTIINLGRLQASNSQSFGTGTVMVNSGGQAYLSATGGTYANNMVISGLGQAEASVTLGALRMESCTLAGKLTVALASRITNNGAALVSNLNGSLIGSSALEINSAAQGASAGTVNVNGNASGYTGTITVSGGRFGLNAPILGSAGSPSSIVVAAAAGVGGEGEVSGSVSLGAGASINTDPASAGSLKVDGLLTTSGTVNVSLTSFLTGSNGALPASGTPFKVVQFGTQSGIGASASNFALATPANYRPGAVFSLNAHDVSLALTKASVEWNNASGGSRWNTNTTANFRNVATGVTDKFFWGDDVLFSDLAGGAQTIAIDGAQYPSTITVNSQYAYTLNNGTSGVIAGGSLLKSGTGTLLVGLANTFAGGTTVSQGEARFANSTGAGSGAITIGDANTGTLAAACLFGGGGTTANDMVVTNQGTGSATIGTYGGGVNTFTGNVTLNRAVNIVDATGDRTTFNGRITGNPGTITITGGRVTFGNPLNAFTGNLSIAPGAIYQNDSASALPTSTSVTVASGGSFRVNNGGTHAINGLSGGSGATATFISGGVATLSLGNGGGSATYTGAVTDGAGTLSIVKNGAGTQMLVGNNTFTGNTDVNGGTLVVGARASGGATTVADGATFGTGGAIGTGWNTTTLTLGASSGATLAITNFSGSATPVVNATTAVVTHGTVPLRVSGSFSVGTFPLIHYPTGGSVGGDGFAAFQLVLPRGVTGVLVDNTFTSTVNLQVLSVDPLVWQGSVDDKWDINTTSNWSVAGSPDKYHEEDVVLLDDSASGSTSIRLDALVAPSSLVVDNSVKDYSITGTGGLTGTTGLTKNGTGKLTLATGGNSYTGATLVNGGTLEIGNGTVNGTIPGGITDNGVVKFNNGSAQAYNEAIGGTGALEKAGPGTLTLGSVHTFGGDLAVHAGRLAGAAARSGTNSVFGPASNARTITVDAGAVLEFQRANTFGNHNTINAPTLVVNGGTVTNSDALAPNLVNNGLNNVVLNGGTLTSTVGCAGTIGGSRPTETYGAWNLNGTLTSTGTSFIGTTAAANGQLMLGSVGADSTFNVSGVLTVSVPLESGAASYLSGLVKSGGGTMVLAAANSYTGPTSVNDGDLRVNGSLTAASAVNVATGGTLSGTGTANGGVTVQAGGTVAPGAVGAGTLTTGAITVQGTYACDIDGANADKLAVNGNLNLTGATLAFSTLSAPNAAAYVIATYTGALTGTPAVTGLPSGYALDYGTTGQIKLVGTAGYSAWATAKGLTGLNNGVAQDPDGDGLTNLMEYYLDGNPLAADAGSLVTSQVSGGYLHLVFKRRDDAEAELVAQTAQYGATLAAWTGVAIGSASTPADANGVIVNVTENGSSPDTVEVLVPTSRAVNGKLFGRVRVTK